MLNLAEYTRRLHELDPGSKLVVAGTVFTVGGPFAQSRNPFSHDHIYWTRMPLVRSFARHNRWLEIPRQMTADDPAHLCWLLGKYTGRASRLSGSFITWRGSRHRAVSGKPVVFYDPQNVVTTKEQGEFITYLPQGLDKKHLRLERLRGQDTWRVYEMTPVKPTTVQFL